MDSAMPGWWEGFFAPFLSAIFVLFLVWLCWLLIKWIYTFHEKWAYELGDKKVSFGYKALIFIPWLVLSILKALAIITLGLAIVGLVIEAFHDLFGKHHRD